MKKNFITGFVSGAVAFSMIGAFAANMITTPNTYEVQLDGKDVNIEGYNVDDYTYFKLRDISDAVGGFDVDYKDNKIVLTSQTGWTTHEKVIQHTLTMQMYFIKYLKMKPNCLWYFYTATDSQEWVG